MRGYTLFKGTASHYYDRKNSAYFAVMAIFPFFLSLSFWFLFDADLAPIVCGC